MIQTIEFFSPFLISMISISTSFSNDLSSISFEYVRFIVSTFKHTLTCFKYRSKKCRFRFSRKIVTTMMFDEAIDIIHIKRDHSYLNNYNKWFSIMTRGNHDIQFLFTKNHALVIVYYIMKYIS